MNPKQLCVACSVQVLYELLKRDPEVAQIPDDKGRIALELAVDRSYDQPSPALDVVVQMLSNPHQAGQLSGNERAHGRSLTGAIQTLLQVLRRLSVGCCHDVC